MGRKPGSVSENGRVHTSAYLAPDVHRGIAAYCVQRDLRIYDVLTELIEIGMREKGIKPVPKKE